jgi:hypothetical protein
MWSQGGATRGALSDFCTATRTRLQIFRICVARCYDHSSRQLRRKRPEHGDYIVEQAASWLLLMLDLAREIRGVPVACSSGAYEPGAPDALTRARRFEVSSDSQA